MKKIINLRFNVQILFLIICTSITAQNYSVNEISKHSKTAVNYFQRLENIPNKNQTSVIFFPNNNGDFWEYIEEDTTTLFSQFLNLKFSVSREVLADTLMSNGLTYKKVKWQNEANSVNYSPMYEHLRVDSTGNAHIFYNTSDYILFDFNLDINQTYPAHLLNHYWKVLDKYNVIGFGDTLQAIDFGLFNQNNIKIKAYSIVEKFGIIFYQELLNYRLPIGNFWGSVVDGQEYGALIVKKQTVDWKEFYPLHIGDYWVYEGEGLGIPVKYTIRIIGDTLMPDANNYFILKKIDYHFHYTSFSYRRIDSLGNVFYWEYWNNLPVQYFKFSYVVGDTLPVNISNSKFRLNDKYINLFTGFFELNFFLYPDIGYTQHNYDLGLGLMFYTGDHYYEECVGAYVNGEIVWGDTTLTDIEDDISTNFSNYKLFQNFPNPFNASTLITFQIPKSTSVSLRVYNVLGVHIKTLIDDYLSSGSYQVIFENSEIPSGIYIYSLTTDQIKLASKMIYLK